MTANFIPPVAAGFDWRDLFSMGDDDDPFWQRVRDRRLGLVSRQMLLNLLTSVTCFGILLFALPDKIGWELAGIWVLTFLFSLRNSSLARNHSPNQSLRHVSCREMQNILLQFAMIGVGWAVILYQLIAEAGGDHAMLLVTVSVCCIGSYGATMAPWPQASLLTPGFMSLGVVGALLQTGWPHSLIVILLLLGMVALIAHGSITTTRYMLYQMRLKERIQEQNEVVRLLLSEFEANGTEWLFEFDKGGYLTFASVRFAEALRRPVAEVIGQHWTKILPNGQSVQELAELIRLGQPYRDRLLHVEIEGENRWWTISGTPKVDIDGNLLGYRGVGSDVTDRQRAAERIAELATFDALTGLVNRRIVHQSLADALHPSSKGAALLFVDLDRFKAVNDSYGHGTGDRLLAEVAQRLRMVVANNGGAGALVGRLGGDEFAVVIPEADELFAVKIGQAIIEHVSRPYSLADKSITVGASIGLAIGPENGATVEALMRAADLALYEAKAKGRGNVRLYDMELHRNAEARRALEADLSSAVSSGQMRLAFQPVVDAIDERIVGFEALARWRHPQHGDISPAVFIPMAEASGQVGRIGSWVLNEACRVAARWPKHIGIAVNVSPLQFDDAGFVDMVRRTLRRWNINPSRLELEITESLFLDERPQTTEMLGELQDMGIGFALDDFGTGYSSLGYLQKVAFRRIKIDRSFVQKSANQGGEATAIIQAIVALANRLGMDTTAEGTETRTEFEAMRRLGCARMQGYYFGKPMPAEDVARLIERSRPVLQLVDDPEQSAAKPATGAEIATMDFPIQPSLSAASELWPVAEGLSTGLRREAPRELPPG